MTSLQKLYLSYKHTQNTLLIFFLLLTLMSSKVFADERIRIHYNERPPYLVTVSAGLVSGLTADVARNAFQNAGIAHYWVKTPSTRQMKILKELNGSLY